MEKASHNLGENCSCCEGWKHNTSTQGGYEFPTSTFLKYFDFVREDNLDKFLCETCIGKIEEKQMRGMCYKYVT